MSETKWTPGPYAVDPNDATVVTADNDGLIVCETGYEDRDFDEQKANAILFAAAPELYGTLEKLTDRFIEAAVLAGTDREFAEIAVQYERSILKKARGES